MCVDMRAGGRELGAMRKKPEELNGKQRKEKEWEKAGEGRNQSYCTRQVGRKKGLPTVVSGWMKSFGLVG